MPKLTITELNKSVEIESGVPILISLMVQGISFGFVCGGNAACGTCNLIVKEGAETLKPRNAKEGFLAKAMMLSDDNRLACQTEMGTGDLTVSVPALGRPQTPFSMPFPK
ncbi:MAG: 2Fe-2S iron-sulfur cluster-binding protein [Leptospirillum sp.]|jgi:2Fe-2S ferredoxin|nr:2Fe-2S iron-sulfur cluster-binding protein [Nitrospiraceae bacterium]